MADRLPALVGSSLATAGRNCASEGRTKGFASVRVSHPQSISSISATFQSSLHCKTHERIFSLPALSSIALCAPISLAWKCGAISDDYEAWTRQEHEPLISCTMLVDARKPVDDSLIGFCLHGPQLVAAGVPTTSDQQARPINNAVDLAHRFGNRFSQTPATSRFPIHPVNSHRPVLLIAMGKSLGGHFHGCALSIEISGSAAGR